MKSYRKELVFNTQNRVELINITDQVAAAVRESGLRKASVWSMRCTSRPVSLSTTTSRGYGRITGIGWKIGPPRTDRPVPP